MTERLVAPQAFANTYAASSYDSGWHSVRAYQEWQAWQAEHPEKGRWAAGRVLEMPPSRVRVWQDGGQPVAVEGLERARERGWIEVGMDTKTAEGLIRMLAWIYSSGALQGGSDSQTTPRFSVRSPDERRRIERWAGKAGVTLRYLHDDDSASGAEAIPTRDGNLLGRVLLALGAHAGPGREYNDLPAAVTTGSSDRIREWFIATYLRNRGTKMSNRPKWIQINESRTPRYQAALAQLLERVLDISLSAESRIILLETSIVTSFLDRVDEVRGPEYFW